VECLRPEPTKTIADPDILAMEIVEKLEAGLESFQEIIVALNGK